jgi:glycogen debranching enzyme
LNALWIGSQFNLRWTPLFEHGRKAFPVYFWNTERNCLFDVIDCDHTPGAKDASLRPNQIFAVGGLPLNLLEPDQARQVVEITETNLWTSLGLRSLAPGEANYTPRYEGGVLQRDGSYHQGTVWPWLAGPFIEAWVRVNGNNADAKDRALEKFVLPLRCHLQEAGVGHLSEIADAETPHHPRGCPFQAWSLGELLRIETFLHSSSQTP